MNAYQLTIASSVEEQTATTAGMDRDVTEAAAGSGEIATTTAGVAAAAQSLSVSTADSQLAAAEPFGVSGRLQAVSARSRV